MFQLTYHSSLNQVLLSLLWPVCYKHDAMKPHNNYVDKIKYLAIVETASTQPQATMFCSCAVCTWSISKIARFHFHFASFLNLESLGAFQHISLQADHSLQLRKYPVHRRVLPSSSHTNKTCFLFLTVSPQSSRKACYSWATHTANLLRVECNLATSTWPQHLRHLCWWLLPEYRHPFNCPQPPAAMGL